MPASEQTDKSRYPSKYSPEKWVHAAQYITELVCERRAMVDKFELPVQFWKDPEWEKFFKFQVLVVHAAIKSYGHEAIIQVLKENKRAWSLKAKWMKPLLKVAKDKVAKENAQKLEDMKNQTPVNRDTIHSKPRPFKASGLLATLQKFDEEVDDGEKESQEEG